MAQYCRYCAHAFEGDCFYCGELDKVLSEKALKRQNHCPRFVLSELGDVETGRKYNQRNSRDFEEKKWWKKHQIDMEELLNENG